MRSFVLAAFAGVALPFAALAQTDAELKAATSHPDQVLTYGMSYSEQRFSPLKQINRATVKRLVPAWSYSLDNNTGEESQPLLPLHTTPIEPIADGTPCTMHGATLQLKHSSTV